MDRLKEIEITAVNDRLEIEKGTEFKTVTEASFKNFVDVENALNVNLNNYSGKEKVYYSGTFFFPSNVDFINVMHELNNNGIDVFEFGYISEYIKAKILILTEQQYDDLEATSSDPLFAIDLINSFEKNYKASFESENLTSFVKKKK